jgi:hypothetical protein
MLRTETWIGSFLTVSCLTLAAPVMAVEYSVNGDMRTGFYSLHRDDRNGKEDTTDELRLRVRAGVGAKLNEQWLGQARFAGRYSTDDRNELHFKIFNSLPADDGLRRGDSTLDEAYVEYRPATGWQLRMGRFQSKAELNGVAKKSLDRNDSPNTDITWTDGVLVRHSSVSGWITTAIAQYNDSEGATQVRHTPLEYSDDDSRVSYFIGHESTRKTGPIVQRAVDVTWLPNALHSRGLGAGPVEDYWGLVGRMAAQWPMRGSMKFMLAGELGYAPNTPQRSTVRTGLSGEADGRAAQLTFNLVDIVPEHSAGLVLGRAGDGWLLSPDFGPNTNLVELRYKWAIDKQQTLEARARNREDINQRVGSVQKREDVDFYVRYTFKL